MLPSSAGSGQEKSSSNRSPPPAAVTAGAAAAAAATAGARYVSVVGPNDVQLGRGRPVVTSEGNKRFRQLILSNRTGYTASGKHAHKDAIARQIVRTIQERGGNFLKKVESASERESLGLSGDDAAAAWVVVDEEASILKVKQALREQESSAKSETSPTSPRKRRKKADGDGVVASASAAADTATVASAVASGVPTQEEHRQQSQLESDMSSTQLARRAGQLKTTGEEDSEGAGATSKSDGSSPDEAPKEATKLLMQLKHYTLGDGGVDNKAGTAWAGESPLSPPLQDANAAGTALEDPTTTVVASTTNMSNSTPTIATAEDERQPTPPEVSLLTSQPMNSAAASDTLGRIDPTDSAALGTDDVQQSHPSSAVKATSADDAMDPNDAPIKPKDDE